MSEQAFEEFAPLPWHKEFDANTGQFTIRNSDGRLLLSMPEEQEPWDIADRPAKEAIIDLVIAAPETAAKRDLLLGVLEELLYDYTQTCLDNEIKTVRGGARALAVITKAHGEGL